MKSLRHLNLSLCGLGTVPSFVCELKSLECLSLFCNDLSSLPKELGELSALTGLALGGNEDLGKTPEDEAFPAELKKMKSLRELYFGTGGGRGSGCGLRTVPAFVGEQESLETLDLSHNEDLQIDASLDFLIEKFPRLRSVDLCNLSEWTRKSRAHLRAFKAKLRAKNPGAEVTHW